jgi:hypothetical protein
MPEILKNWKTQEMSPTSGLYFLPEWLMVLVLPADF